MSNITVLTPAYNRGKLLEKLYESLCAQDCKDFEWLIVDDGKDYKGSITVKIDAIAASAASVVAMAGDTVQMSPVAMLMIHDPSTVAMGNTKDSSCEIKCVAFVRMVYKNAHWNKRRSYRMIGNPFQEQRLVSFQIQEALPIENGRVLDETVSPTFALCREESSPMQNNPTSEEKADSGAV